MLSYRLAALQADSTSACTHFGQCAYSTSVCVATIATTTARVTTCRTGLRSKIVDVTARFGSSDSLLIASSLPLEQSRRGARRQPRCSIKNPRDFRNWHECEVP